MKSQRGRSLRGVETQRPRKTTETVTVDDAELGDRTTRELTKSQAFDALRNSRRRAAIVCLREHGENMSVNELATRVAAEEYDVAPEELSSEQYKRVYTGLYQCHLDRAADLGIVDFDSNDNTVRLREEAAQLGPYLDDGDAPGSARVELGVAATIALLIALSNVGVGPFGSISPSLLATVPIVALLGLALFQLYYPGSKR